MAIREDIINGMIRADEDRIAARAMAAGPERDAAWKRAMDSHKEWEDQATPEEKAAANAAILQGYSGH